MRESFTPVVLRPKPGDVAHGLIRVFDHETGMVLYDEEVHDDSSFRKEAILWLMLHLSKILLHQWNQLAVGMTGEISR